MKRILLIILAMFALSSFYGKAQIADVRTLDYKSGNLYLDGDKVKKAAARDLFDNDMYKDFKGGRRKWNAGVGVLSFGGTVTTFGGIVFIANAVESNKNYNPDAPSSGVGFVIGGSLMVIGAVFDLTGGLLMNSGKKQLKGIRDTYNANLPYTPELALGSTENGIGLCLYF